MRQTGWFCWVMGLLIGWPLWSLAQPGSPSALIAPDRPVSLSQTRPPSGPPKKDFVPRQNNGAITLAEAHKNGPALALLDRAAQTRPSDTLAYNRALLLIRLKRYDEAAKILAERPAFAHAQLNLGLLQSQLGVVQQGLKTLESAPVSADWVSTKALNRALLHYQSGYYEDALYALESAANNSIAQLLRADIAVAKGQYNAALKRYKELEDDETFGPIIPVRVGNALLGLRRFKDAIKEFENYLKSGDRTAIPSARLGLASALYGLDDYEEAIGEYRAAVQLMPQSDLARTGLANAYASNHDYRNARTYYEAVLKQNPEHTNAQMGLGVVAFRQNKPDEAASHFAQIKAELQPTNPDHADAFLHQGLLALRQNQPDTAQQALEVALRLRPGDASGLSGLSELYRKQELYGKALEALDQTIYQTAKHHWPGATQPTPEMSAKTKARMLANRGSLLLKINQIEQAYPVFKEALKNDRSNVNALNGLAVSLLEMDKLDQAGTVYDSLINGGIRKSFLHNNRGIVRAYEALQADKRNQTDKARQLYQRALADYERAQQLDTTRKFYQNNLGNVLKNLGRYKEAIEHYENYFSKSAINNLGALYAADKKPDFSRYYLNLAIQLDSNNAIYHYNRAQFYRQFHPDSLILKPNVVAAERQMSMGSISTKYSRDGFVNIYLYDYDFDASDYPADHRFPIRPEIPRAPDLLPVEDFVRMPEPGNPTPPTTTTTPKLTANTRSNFTPGDTPPPRFSSSASASRPARMPRSVNARRTRQWGSTRCPKF